jgi:DNA-binding NarL/FixJ family response regulator
MTALLHELERLAQAYPGKRGSRAAVELWADLLTDRGRLLALLRDQRRRERLQQPPVSPSLTTREREVLRLIAEGRDNSAIAAELVISPATVKTHVAHLLKKLNLDNRVQAAVFAVRHGLA